MPYAALFSVMMALVYHWRQISEFKYGILLETMISELCGHEDVVASIVLSADGTTALGIEVLGYGT